MKYLRNSGPQRGRASVPSSWHARLNSEAGDYMVVGPDWKGETRSGIKKVFQSGTQFDHLLRGRSTSFSTAFQMGHSQRPY